MKNIYLKSVKSKYSFSQVFDPLASCWSIIIKSHWRMLCPNTQVVINGYAAGWGPRQFFPKRAEIWIWGWKNVYMKKGGGAIPFFTDLPEFGFVDGKFLCG